MVLRRAPNTLDARRLIGLADTGGIQDAVVEPVFRAYFTEGRDIDRTGVVLDVAAEAGRQVTARHAGGTGGG